MFITGIVCFVAGCVAGFFLKGLVTKIIEQKKKAKELKEKDTPGTSETEPTKVPNP